MFFRRRALVLSIILVFLAGCDSESLLDQNGAPEAQLTAAAEALVGEQVSLSAGGSADPDGDALTYTWSFATKPDTSATTISSPDQVQASFVPDVPGTYTVQISVSDGDDSDAATADVTVTYDLELRGTLDADTTLYDRGAPYTVTASLNVSGATLTLSPGVTLEFSQGARLVVATGGALSAVGTETDSIRLVGATESAGFWDGIEIASASAANELDYVEVAHGGDAGWAGVYVQSTGSAAVRNSRIHTNAVAGVYVEDGGSLAGWSANELAGNANAGVSAPSSVIGSLDAASDYAGGDTPWGVEVRGGTLSAAATWPALGSPYRVTASPAIQDSVRVEPGAELYFDQGVRLRIIDTGILTAIGTETDSIRFLGSEATASFWDGIEIATARNGNRLEYVEVAHGGDSGWADVYVQSTGLVSVVESRIHDSGTDGLYVEDGGSIGPFAGNDFADNAGAGVSAAASAVGALDSGSSYDGGATDYGVEVRGGVMATASTWPALGSRYLVSSSPAIEADLTIEPGAWLEFGQDTRMRIHAGGSLSAEGTATDSIRFLGANPSKGFWHGIEFGATDVANVLDYVEVGWGGGSGWANVYVQSTGSAIVSNSRIHDSAECGIETESGGTMAATNNTYSGNTGGDICP